MPRPSRRNIRRVSRMHLSDGEKINTEDNNPITKRKYVMQEKEKQTVGLPENAGRELKECDKGGDQALPLIIDRSLRLCCVNN